MQVLKKKKKKKKGRPKKGKPEKPLTLPQASVFHHPDHQGNLKIPPSVQPPSLSFDSSTIKQAYKKEKKNPTKRPPISSLPNTTEEVGSYHHRNKSQVTARRRFNSKQRHLHSPQ